ncbi:MAG: serine hydrolase, partial [Pseudomonadota bacterium]
MAEQLMQGFPASSDNQVTLANWRQAPWSSWAFHHVREILATAEIRNRPEDLWTLDEAPVNLGGISIDLADGGVMSIAGFLDTMHIDAMLVLHRDRIVYEHYRPGMDRYHPHILFSVSKSVLGMVCGILEHQQRLDISQPVTRYLPELASTAYRDTTVRELLDMRAAVAFEEDYLATEGPIIQYRKATGWNPLDEGEQPGDLRSFYQTLTDLDPNFAGEFAYKSPNTDLLAWIIERACNQPYADVISDTLWQPMGAESSAYITVDRFGAPRAAGGVCTTLRDLARVGRLMAHDGKRGSLQVLPPAWTTQLVEQGDKDA